MLETEPQMQTAFPIFGGNMDFHLGLTKREYFAAFAIAGLLATETEAFSFGDERRVAKEAVAVADALIKALEE